MACLKPAERNAAIADAKHFLQGFPAEIRGHPGNFVQEIGPNSTGLQKADACVPQKTRTHRFQCDHCLMFFDTAEFQSCGPCRDASLQKTDGEIAERMAAGDKAGADAIRSANYSIDVRGNAVLHGGKCLPECDYCPRQAQNLAGEISEDRLMTFGWGSCFDSSFWNVDPDVPAKTDICDFCAGDLMRRGKAHAQDHE